MLFATRRLHAPALDASHEDTEVRTPHLRLAVRRGHNVTTDYALLGRSVPFAHRMARPQISVLFAGGGRIEECGRRLWVASSDVVISDGGARRGGSMAYTGPELHQLLVEWDPAVFGAPWDRELDALRLRSRDLGRLAIAAERAARPETARDGLRSVLELLRAAGVPFTNVEVPITSDEPRARLWGVVGSVLSSLVKFPSIDDVTDALAWNPRRVHRALKGLAHDYALPWTEWRSALHSQRMLDATRLLGAPGATTELVARLTGFRSPSALCHAFANAELPSPGTLARAAQRDVLDAWSRA